MTDIQSQAQALSERRVLLLSYISILTNNTTYANIHLDYLN